MSGIMVVDRCEALNAIKMAQAALTLPRLAAGDASAE